MLVVLGLGLGSGCEGEPGTSTPDASFCDDAPQPVTWDNFGRSFVTERCQACHASATVDRQGAPEAVFFDTEEDVWRWADRVVAVAGPGEPLMPPQGGVEADDRYLLEVWLTCGG